MAADIKQEIEQLVKLCYQCGTCSGVCPKSRVKPGFLPRRMAFNLITGHEERTIDTGEPWDCLTCGHCQAVCPMEINFVDMIKEARQIAPPGVNCRIAHENTLGPSFYNIIKSPKLKPKRKELLADDVQIDENSKTLYFMGCINYQDIVFRDDVGFEGMNIADNTIRLMNKVGVKPAIAENERCCGHDQLWRGEIDTFMEMAKQNAEYLKDYDTVVVSCPECLRTLSKDYKERLGLDLNVIHISEYLKGHKEELEKSAGENKKTVTFHDSCRLGRHMGIYDAPRELLEAMGYDIKEMESAKEDALCCGVPQFVNCDDENKKIRKRRMDEALDTGAEIMVIPCSKCQIHFKCLQNDAGEGDRYKGIKVVDFSTILMDNLQGVKKDE